MIYPISQELQTYTVDNKIVVQQIKFVDESSIRIESSFITDKYKQVKTFRHVDENTCEQILEIHRPKKGVKTSHIVFRRTA